MSSMIDEDTLKEVRSMLAEMEAPVTLVHFTQEAACGACLDQRDLLETLAETSDRLTLEVHDLVKDAALAREHGIDKVPATAVLGERDYGIRFYGLTGGYEFASLLEDILMVSHGSSDLGHELERACALIDVPTEIEVMVTLTCPYCPKMVRLAHQMAYVNEHIRAAMVDAAEFPQLVQRYQVSGVPRTVIDGRPAFEGALPPIQAILEVLKAVKPEAYQRLEEQAREARGERAATEAMPDRVYDTIIVGAGPAAMSATIYAARKALDVAVLGQHIGGQITDTATIENWPGAPSIGGDELAAQLRAHAERYPVAERLGVEVAAIERTDQGFAVTTADAQRYRARTVIYCAGKQYRRLGVPGEARFLGHGIAFCATCDAPLFTDKRVAVVGGGNSAFTAARDLLNFAREVHIINILPDFQADPVLVEEVTASGRVTLHPATTVKEFLGQDQLTGARLESADGRERQDLSLDGAFLEIGLVPNTGPVAGLIETNAQGEVPVARDQSTSVPGLFAAGDVSDEPDKQIVIAAAAGAKAALSVDRYLTGGGSPA